jgi:hypothetical protein
MALPHGFIVSVYCHGTKRQFKRQEVDLDQPFDLNRPRTAPMPIF